MNEVYHSLRAEGIQFPSPQKPKKEFTQVTERFFNESFPRLIWYMN